MNIEIHQPELEALIQKHMASGAFHDIEEVLLYALKSAPPGAPNKGSSPSTQRTGTDLIAVMQAMPYKDEIEFGSPSQRKSLAQLFAESPFHGTEMDFPRDKAPLGPVDLSDLSDVSDLS